MLIIFIHILMVVAAVVASDNDTQTDGDACGRTGFRCGGADRCIPLSWLCDGSRDCMDGSDETHQHCDEHHKDNSPCFGNQPDCVYNGIMRCILHEWLCDGHKDCDNGEDEVGCESDSAEGAAGCGVAEFACSSGGCVARDLVCNDVSDCMDGSDEAAERCSMQRSQKEPKADILNATAIREEVPSTGRRSSSSTTSPITIQANKSETIQGLNHTQEPLTSPKTTSVTTTMKHTTSTVAQSEDSAITTPRPLTVSTKQAASSSARTNTARAIPKTTTNILQFLFPPLPPLTFPTFKPFELFPTTPRTPTVTTQKATTTTTTTTTAPPVIFINRSETDDSSESSTVTQKAKDARMSRPENIDSKSSEVVQRVILDPSDDAEYLDALLGGGIFSSSPLGGVHGNDTNRPVRFIKGIPIEPINRRTPCNQTRQNG